MKYVLQQSKGPLYLGVECPVAAVLVRLAHGAPRGRHVIPSLPHRSGLAPLRQMQTPQLVTDILTLR